MAPTADDYRTVMRRLPTGVCVLTMRGEDGPHGMTANTVTSVSLDPLLLLACIDRTARAHGWIESSGEFVVNVLGAGQADLSRRFAVRDLSDAERWEGVRTVPSRTLDIPRIAGCNGYIECRVRDTHDGGDHSIFVAEVVDVEPALDAQPLVFWKRSYRTVTPE
ncbi:MAG TPA: flavin reductase family protein [Actinomycetota bacterium]|nr:flavin reductase family protein [Actinomycetota bacterium]